MRGARFAGRSGCGGMKTLGMLASAGAGAGRGGSANRLGLGGVARIVTSSLRAGVSAAATAAAAWSAAGFGAALTAGAG